jgi:hypothetical protein
MTSVAWLPRAWLTLPHQRITLADPRLRAGWLVLLSAAVIGALFLPRAITNSDEYYYAGQAYVLSHGRVVPQAGDPLPLPEVEPALAFRFPIAWPALLSLARLISFRAMFVLAFAVHLLGAVAAMRMLVRRGAPASMVALYVFHPALFVYGRTLMSDVPAVAALLIAMDAWENSNAPLSAAGLGFASGMRFATFSALLGFGLATLHEWRRRQLAAVSLALGVALFLGVQALTNQALAGSAVSTPYVNAAPQLFGTRLLFENLLLYGAGLALLPPFPLLAAFAAPERVDRWALMALPVVIGALSIDYHDRSSNLLETLVGGQRYTLPAHAALLIATARTWSGWVPVKRRFLVPVAGLTMGLVGCLAMSRLEARYRGAADQLASCAPERVAYNYFAHRVAGSVEASDYVMLADDSAAASTPWDALVLAPGPQSNRPGFDEAWRDSPPHIAGARCVRVGAYALYERSGKCALRGAACDQGLP